MKFNKSEILTFSNFLSLLRVVMIIPLWILMNDLEVESIRYTVGFLCIFAALTDILDGYFARKFHQETEFGKIVDPLADKIIVGAVVIKLFLIGDLPGYYFYMVIIRDLLIFIGGIIVTRKLGRVLPSNVLGKITVVFISLVLLMILFQTDRGTLYFKFFYYSSLILIVASLAAYVIRAMEFLKKRENGSVRKFQF
jgi:cardiolipin synthase (CMP-forming)